MAGVPDMADIVPCEQFLLRRVAAEQQRAAQSMRGLVDAVEQFISVVDRACVDAKGELERALARTAALRQSGADDRSRTEAALADGRLETMIAERDRLLAGRPKPTGPDA